MNCHSCDVLIKPRKIPLDVTKLREFSKNCRDCVKTCMEYKKKGKVPATCRDYVSNNKMLIKILEKMSEKPIKVKKNIKNTFPKDLETKDVLFRHNKRTLNPRSTGPVRSTSHRPITVVPHVIPSRYQGPRGPRGISGLNTSSPTTQRPSGSNGTRRPPTTQIVHPAYEVVEFNTSRPRGIHPDYEALGFNTSRPPTNQGPRGIHPDYEALGFNAIRPPTTQGPRGAPPAYEALGFNAIRPPTTQGPRGIHPGFETLGFNTSSPPTNQGPRRGAPSGFEGVGFNTSRPRGTPSVFETMGLNYNHSPTTQGPRRGAPSGFEGLGVNTSRPRGIPAGYEEIMRRFNAA
jgi:hypothetical protein